MLIYIQDSLVNSLESNDDLILLLNHLGECGFHGVHFVIATRTSLKTLKNFEPFSKAARTYYGNILKSYPDRKAAIKYIEEYIVLTFEEYIYVTGSVWHVPFKLLHNSFMFSETKVIGENVKDVNFFEESAIQYKKYIGLATYRLNIDDISGGGSTTYHVFKNESEKHKSPVLCITDSDQKSPVCKFTNHVYDCRKFSNNYNTTWIIDHVIIDVHTVENLIPLGMHEIGLQRKDQLDKFELLKDRFYKVPDLFKYADLKRGIYLCDIFNFSQHIYDFYMNYYNSLISLSHINPKCLYNNECLASYEDCKCIIFPSLGDNICEQILKAISNKNQLERTHIALHYGDVSNDSWFFIGKKVFEWGIALKQMRLS
jgi:hypothetical protein